MDSSGKCVKCTSLKGMPIKELSLLFIQISRTSQFCSRKSCNKMLISSELFRCFLVFPTEHLRVARIHKLPFSVRWSASRQFSSSAWSHFTHRAIKMIIIATWALLCKCSFNASHVRVGMARGSFTHMFKSALEHERGLFMALQLRRDIKAE